jgi:hypothetical protein
MQMLTTQLVRIHQPSPGTYTAEVVGLPEVQATAASSQDAVGEVLELLERRLSSGQLVQVTLRPPPTAPRDPNDPLEQEFLEELERNRREDLERTMKEYDPQCSSSSSTPTT